MGNTTRFHPNHKLWIASYGNLNKKTHENPPAIKAPTIGGWNDFVIWQNAIQAGVKGIGGVVDRDVVFVPRGLTLGSFLST
jgi:hypothetical protein